MIFNYSLDQDDYLTYLFYSTSKSKKVQKRRSLNKLILMIMYVVTGMYLHDRNGPIASAIFFLLCFPLYFLYNTFEKKQYLKHFKKFINHHFIDRIGKEASIELAENNFHVVDDEDNWYAYEDIESVTETNALIIIQLKSGVAILLPKNKIQNVDALIEKLSQMASLKNIVLNKEPAWKWK